MAESGDELHQPLRRVARLAPSNLFHKAAAEQEKHQHGNRFEIHALPRIGRQTVNPRGKRHHNRQRNRRIHTDAAVFQIAPRSAVKRLRAVKHGGQRHQKTAPVQYRQVKRFDVAAVKISRHGKHHSLHHRQPRHGKAHYRLLALFLRLHFYLLHVIRSGGIARRLNPQQDVRQSSPVIVPDHAGAVGAVIQIHPHHTVQTQKLLLNQPYAGRAGNAAQHQHGLAFSALSRRHKIGLYFRQVVKFQLRQHVRRRQHGFFRLGGTLLVVAAQSGVDNALRHGLTACATGLVFFVFKTDGETDIFGHFQPAVETIVFHDVFYDMVCACRQAVFLPQVWPNCFILHLNSISLLFY